MIQAQRLIPIEFTPYSASAVETGGTGIVRLAVMIVRLGYVALLERISVRTNSTTASVATVYVSDNPSNLSDDDIVDFTNSGNGDVADESQAIRMFGGQTLLIRWTGLSAAARATTRCEVVLTQPQHLTIPDQLDLTDAPAYILDPLGGSR